MTCAELIEVVTEYLDGALSVRDRARFERHVAACPGCATYLDQMRQTIRVMGRLTEESLPPDARDELLAAFAGWHRVRSAPPAPPG